MVLYEDSIDRKNQDMKFLAILNGADPKELGGKESGKSTESGLLFGDPAEYEKMTKEKREELTKKMMAKFSPLVGGIGKASKVSKNVR
jgi:hypothetical protein